MPAELQVQLVDVLLKDNDSLTKALCTVTQEKAELRLAVSQLETSLKQHLLKGRVRSVRTGASARRWREPGFLWAVGLSAGSFQLAVMGSDLPKMPDALYNISAGFPLCTQTRDPCREMMFDTCS